MAGMLLATHCGNIRRQRGECHLGRLGKEGVAVKEKGQGPTLTVSHFGGESYLPALEMASSIPVCIIHLSLPYLRSLVQVAP